MNIAFFSKHLPSDEPNGVSVQVHRLAEALTALGHTVTVFTFSPSVEGASYRSTTLPSGTTSRWLGKFYPAFAFSKVDVSQFDIVHYHGDDYLCRGTVRQVRTFYGSALREALHAGSIGRWCYQTLFYLFEWISCLKKGTKVVISADTSRYLPLVREHIPCGVPLERYRPSGKKTAHSSILFLGDFKSRKRGGLLLELFASEIRPTVPDCILTVVGPVPCSGEGIRYLGRCSETELIAVMQENWILCMPSSYEGFGVPVIEAMACGTAVVATRNPGSNHLINDGVDGVLCTPESLGATVIGLLRDKSLRERLSAEGSHTAERYDSLRGAARYVALYRNAMEAATAISR